MYDKERFENLLDSMEESPLFSEADIQELKTDMEIAEMTGSKLLTNIGPGEKENILEAARKTGFDIYVEDYAFDRNGGRVEGCVSVYTKNIYRCHSEFWKVFKKLKG